MERFLSELVRVAKKNLTEEGEEQMATKKLKRRRRKSKPEGFQTLKEKQTPLKYFFCGSRKT